MVDRTGAKGGHIKLAKHTSCGKRAPAELSTLKTEKAWRGVWMGRRGYGRKGALREKKRDSEPSEQKAGMVVGA